MKMHLTFVIHASHTVPRLFHAAHQRTFHHLTPTTHHTDHEQHITQHSAEATRSCSRR